MVRLATLGFYNINKRDNKMKVPTTEELLWELYELNKKMNELRKLTTHYQMESEASRVIIKETLNEMVGVQPSWKSYHDELIEYCKKTNTRKNQKGIQSHHIKPRRSNGNGPKVNVTNAQHNLFHYLLYKVDKEVDDLRSIQSFRLSRGHSAIDRHKSDGVDDVYDQLSEFM